MLSIFATERLTSPRELFNDRKVCSTLFDSCSLRSEEDRGLAPAPVPEAMGVKWRCLFVGTTQSRLDIEACRHGGEFWGNGHQLVTLTDRWLVEHYS